MKRILFTLLLSLPFLAISQYSWTEQSTAYPVASTYTGDVSIVDANIAWAMAQRTSTTNHQRVSFTTDGGTTWTTKGVTLPSTTALGIGNIAAVSATTAYISVFPTGSAITNQGIYRTTDSGTTWARQTTAAFTTGTSFTNFVHFWDANNGVCMGDPAGGYFEIYTTTNGGTNWTRVPSANIPAITSGGEYGYTGKYYVKGNTVWFGTDTGRLFKSTNKGLNWTVIQSPITDFGGLTDTNSAGEFAFADDNIGVLQNTVTGDFYQTTDGGANWIPVAPNGTMFIGAIDYAGPGLLVSGGSTTGNFGSSYSVDNGSNWTAIDALSHTCLRFASPTLGYSGGFATSATVGGIYKWVNASAGVDDIASSQANSSIYPNPVKSTFQVKLSEDFNAIQTSLIITDLSGKKVKEFSVADSYNISELPKGIYLLSITDGKKSENKKIVKQ